MSVSVTNLGIEGIEDIEQIGSGGSSRVYRARQSDLDRVVAIKVINADHTTDVARRFDRERKAMGRLSLHEGIVPVYTSGVTAHGEPYLIMPFFSNGSLQDQIDMGALEWETAVGYVDAAAETIAAAHDEDVVHLDLKPANILLTKTGAPRIADFGIAKLGGNAAQTNGSSSATAFTPAYSAPETFLDGETGPPSDVYGLGATLWALLVGHPPFLTPGEDTNLMAVIGRVVNNPVSDLRHFTPAPICDVIERAMAKHPQNRFQTAREFSQALKVAANQARSDAGQDDLVTTGTSLFPEQPEGQTQFFQDSSIPEPRPVAGSVQYVPPLNPTPAPTAPVAHESASSSRRLLETSTDVYAGPPGPTPTVHKEPLVDWDEFRILPLLIGLVALTLVGGIAIWALTRGGGNETETANVGSTVTTAPESPQSDLLDSTQPSSSVSLGSDITIDEDDEFTTSESTDTTTTTTEQTTTSTDSSSTSSSSTSSTVETPDAPGAPVNVRALLQSNGSVAISWSAPSGTTPTSYEVFRNGTKIATVDDATSHTDSSVQPGEQYLYRLRSVGSNPETVSDQTPAISISVPDNEPETPGVPGNPRFVIQTNGSVAITWSAPSGTSPTGYEIFRDGSSLTVVRTGTSYTDTTTQPSQTYSYRLRSLGEGQNNSSAQTQAFQITIPDPEPVAPQPPTDLQGSVRANGNVDLRWVPPTAGTTPTGYEVFRNGTKLATTTTPRRYTDATTVDGETYTYSVRSLGPDNTTSVRTPTISIDIPGQEPTLTLSLTPGTVTSNSITVDLTANLCSQFRVSWTNAANETSAVTTPTTGCSETAEVTIPGLEADSLYRILATAETASDQTASATPQEITTEP